MALWRNVNMHIDFMWAMTDFHTKNIQNQKFYVHNALKGLSYGRNYTLPPIPVGIHTANLLQGGWVD